MKVMAEKNDKNMGQISCRQCGTCCEKGGPALHSSDLPLLEQKKIPREDLLTIREGELAWTPRSEKVEATRTELIKLRGTKGSWRCCYLDKTTGNCTIYDIRPLACRVLKCWQPEESIALAGTDLLTRSDILKGDGRLMELVTEYEAAFRLPDFMEIYPVRENESDKIISFFEDMVNRDLQFRDYYVGESNIVACQEMFLFGRPLFQLLQPLGICIRRSGNVFRLYLSERK